MGDGRVLAERLAVGPVRLRRLRLGKLILGEAVRAARDRQEQRHDADRNEEQAGTARSRSRVVRTGRRVLSWLAHLDWVE